MTGDHQRLPEMSGVIPPLFRAGTQDDESVAQMIALLDVQDALPSARRLHEWGIKTAAVRPGDQVIDLGSGTGTISRQLAGLVASGVSTDGGPRGGVTGVEPNARLRAVAESRGERRRTECFVHRWTRRRTAIRRLERGSGLVRARAAASQRPAGGN